MTKHPGHGLRPAPHYVILVRLPNGALVGITNEREDGPYVGTRAQCDAVMKGHILERQPRQLVEIEI